VRTHSLVLGLGLGVASVLAACASPPPPSTPAPPKAAAAKAPAADACRRDESPPTLSQRLRDKFNVGFMGDEAAFDDGYREVKDIVAREPQNPDALVFLGAAELFLSGRAAMKGEREKMMGLWGEGMAKLDRGMALAPEDTGVTAAYGAATLTAGLHVPYDPVALPAVKKGLAAYEKLLAKQAPTMHCLSTHARCELLLGAGEGWARLGERDKARSYYQRVAAECRDDKLPDYEQEAAAWLGGRTERGHVHRCVGCHGP
jgi:hypothetical protein